MAIINVGGQSKSSTTATSHGPIKTVSTHSMDGSNSIIPAVMVLVLVIIITVVVVVEICNDGIYFQRQYRPSSCCSWLPATGIIHSSSVCSIRDISWLSAGYLQTIVRRGQLRFSSTNTNATTFRFQQRHESRNDVFSIISSINATTTTTTTTTTATRTGTDLVVSDRNRNTDPCGTIRHLEST